MRAVLIACLAAQTGCTHKQSLADGYLLDDTWVIVETEPGHKEDGEVLETVTGQIIRTSHGDFGLHEVHKITDVWHFRGAIEGLGLGFGIGAAGGAIFDLASGDDACGVDSCFLVISILAGSVGGFIGLLAGAVHGSRDVYEVGGTKAPAPRPRFVPSGPPGSTVGATVRF